MKQPDQPVNDTWLISARKLAALDMLFHNPVVILVEFLGGTILSAALGAFLIFFAANRMLSHTLFGLYFLGIATNYALLLFFALLIRNRDQAERELGAEVHNLESTGCKYTLQSVVLLVIPFALVLLSLYQRLRLTK